MKKLLCLLALMLLSGLPASAAEHKIFYASGPKDAKSIAITFDDGPGPYTERILEVLAKNNVKATFFMEGLQAKLRPALAARVAAGGHVIGNHTYSHVNYFAYKKDDKEKVMSDELSKAHESILKSTGIDTKLLRMPNGYSKQWARELAGREGYYMVNWTFGCDWNKMTTEELAAVYLKNVKPGAILLMHDGGKDRHRTLEILPRIIEEAKRQGLSIVTVPELLGLKDVNRKADVSAAAVISRK